MSCTCVLNIFSNASVGSRGAEAMSCCSKCTTSGSASCCPCCICCWELPEGKATVREEPEYDEDTQALIDQFRDLMGWGESKPKNSEWLAMDKRANLCIEHALTVKTNH